MTPAFGKCLGVTAGDFGKGGRLGGKFGLPGGFLDGVVGIPRPLMRIFFQILCQKFIN